MRHAVLRDRQKSHGRCRLLIYLRVDEVEKAIQSYERTAARSGIWGQKRGVNVIEGDCIGSQDKGAGIMALLR